MADINRKPRQRTAIRPILRSLHNMNYAGFVSGLRASPGCAMLAVTNRGTEALLPGLKRSGKSSDIGKLIPARSAMVLFFHCSFPEHNSYRFA
jgi:hypothetical protein